MLVWLLPRVLFAVYQDFLASFAALRLRRGIGLIDQVQSGELTDLVDSWCRDYIKQLNIYRQRIWKCKYTGAGELTYEEALTSEYSVSQLVDKVRIPAVCCCIFGDKQQKSIPFIPTYSASLPYRLVGVIYISILAMTIRCQIHRSLPYFVGLLLDADAQAVRTRYYAACTPLPRVCKHVTSKHLTALGCQICSGTF